MNTILYKKSKDGKKTQYWEIQVNGAAYRTVEGYVGGALTESEWTNAVGKNIGKANETSPEGQAILEAESKAQKKKDRGYCENIGEAARPFGVTLAKKWEDYKSKVEYPVFVQGKADGTRIYLKDGKLLYRSNKEVTSCDHLKFDCDYIVDGELYNHDLKDDFNKIISLTRCQEAKVETVEKIKFYVFDIVCDKPYAERLEILKDIAAKNENVVVIPTEIANSEEEVDALLKKYLEMGYEGAMIRWGNDGYILERTNKLLKFKKFFDDKEFLVVDILEGRGKREGTVGKWVVKTEDGVIVEAGPTGKDEDNKKIFLNKQNYIGKMATIKFQGYTPDGSLRFPTFKSIRDDI